MTTHQQPFQQTGPAAHVSVVYDASDGRVLHLHEFIGAGFDPDECSRIALDAVKPLLEYLDSLGASRPAQVAVLHAPSSFQFRPGERLRVDVTTYELMTAEP